MENSKTRAAISFRFNRLDKMQAFTLEREIQGALRDENVENNVYVVCVPLTETNFDDISDYYVRQRVNIEDCDIFVSVCSDSGTNLFDIPMIVNRMLKYIDCKLTFAFTVL
ncbi:hypothetical protein [Colwellia hornerae]|uniref:Uncharacterized protein n=1 Tax=Colwellia hornerae TaxID=89402 RepID=A0A5C6Q3B8_9GAMM|nr:hypothetical protein [Colwellia hornerae]TWX47199.1 hypothetical protein ESZ28_17710 [Colwellia hornerae]TWX54501.1 hypothetical protein ESZ26_17680 [Colwellia hornerae]TWX63281.1 hypothetical protein ESZ27_17265 [Colwellia hornerae]